jgi:hypothetical protein
MSMAARFGVAERDVVEPLDVALRREITRRLLVSAGFALQPAAPDVARDDPWVTVARLAGG